MEQLYIKNIKFLKNLFQEMRITCSLFWYEGLQLLTYSFLVLNRSGLHVRARTTDLERGIFLSGINYIF